jgi:hypothetical protein
VAQLKIVYWRDIPGQVVIREGGRSTRLRLPYRFMKAIERAGYRLRKKQQDALFEPWHDVTHPFSGNIREQASLLVQQLEAQYTQEVLETLVRASGIDETHSPDAPVE